MFRFARVLAVVGLALLAGCGTMAPQKGSTFTQASEDAPLVHALSGFAFPERIGAFRRGPVLRYNNAGDDVSVGYDEDSSEIVATLYVYPTHGRTLEAEFAARQHEVSQAHPDAQLISSGNVAVTPKRISAPSASYTFAVEVAGGSRELRSELLVAQSGNWFVEYRISYPAENQASAAAKVKALLQKFAWP